MQAMDTFLGLAITVNSYEGEKYKELCHGSFFVSFHISFQSLAPACHVTPTGAQDHQRSFPATSLPVPYPQDH